ncbi:DLW-39 family protein [Nesterenkonia xinjiangensis]
MRSEVQVLVRPLLILDHRSNPRLLVSREEQLMRRLAVTALLVAGILGYRRWRQAEDGRRVWRGATDSV